MSIIGQMLAKYSIETENDIVNALKEIFQEITLLGLYRANFFSKAVFYGGTSLRILYGLNRFSEDLDFSLIEKNNQFDIESYFPSIIEEFRALGISVEIAKKAKKKTNSIESAFLRSDTAIYTLNIESEELNDLLTGVHSGKKIKIKLEVDTNPPLKFQTEVKTLLLPVTFNIVTMTLPNLYAGKMHAVLVRKWKNRVKGRDWYDFEWYVKRDAKLNLEHLCERMIESGDLQANINFDQAYFIQLMHDRIEDLDVEKAIEEVRPFVKNTNVLNAWSKDYFNYLTSKIHFES